MIYSYDNGYHWYHSYDLFHPIPFSYCGHESNSPPYVQVVVTTTVTCAGPCSHWFCLVQLAIPEKHVWPIGAPTDMTYEYL